MLFCLHTGLKAARSPEHKLKSLKPQVSCSLKDFATETNVTNIFFFATTSLTHIYVENILFNTDMVCRILCDLEKIHTPYFSGLQYLINSNRLCILVFEHHVSGQHPVHCSPIYPYLSMIFVRPNI